MFKKKFTGMVFTRREIKREAKKYKGWDYCEVYEALGLDCKPDFPSPYDRQKHDQAEEKTYDLLRDEISKCYRELCWNFNCDGELSERSRRVILVCRAYTYAAGHLKGSVTFLKPVWVGLSKVGHDEEFLKLFRVLFPFIWD